MVQSLKDKVVSVFLAVVLAVGMTLPTSALADITDGSHDACIAHSDSGWCVDENGHCEVPADVTSIPDYEFAFSCYNELKSVHIPGNVKTVGTAAFVQCSHLTSVVMDEGVERIEGIAFHNTPLSSISIPSTVNYIGNAAFTWTNIEFFDQVDGLTTEQKIEWTEGYGDKGNTTPDFREAAFSIIDGRWTVRYTDTEGNEIYPEAQFEHISFIDKDKFITEAPDIEGYAYSYNIQDVNDYEPSTITLIYESESVYTVESSGLPDGSEYSYEITVPAGVELTNSNVWGYLTSPDTPDGYVLTGSPVIDNDAKTITVNYTRQRIWWDIVIDGEYVDELSVLYGEEPVEGVDYAVPEKAGYTASVEVDYDEHAVKITYTADAVEWTIDNDGVVSVVELPEGEIPTEGKDYYVLDQLPAFKTVIEVDEEYYRVTISYEVNTVIWTVFVEGVRNRTVEGNMFMPPSTATSLSDLVRDGYDAIEEYDYTDLYVYITYKPRMTSWTIYTDGVETGTLELLEIVYPTANQNFDVPERDGYTATTRVDISSYSIFITYTRLYIPNSGCCF